MRSLLGLTNDEVPEVVEEVYQGWYGVVSSILPYWHQDHFMAELHEEVSQHLIRPGIWGTIRAPRSLSSGRKCSCTCSSSQTWLPSLSTNWHEGTSASQWHGYSHMWAHQLPSTGPVELETSLSFLQWQWVNPLLLTGKTQALWSHQCQMTAWGFHDTAFPVQA